MSVLTNNALLGTKTEWLDQGDRIVVATEQVVDPIIESNRALANLFDRHSRYADPVHNLVARIPLALFFELKRKGIVDDDAAFKKWLNDPDNAAFRTRPGRV